MGQPGYTLGMENTVVRVFERFQLASGAFEYRWMWMYWVKGERRFAATKEDALKAVR